MEIVQLVHLQAMEPFGKYLLEEMIREPVEVAAILADPVNRLKVMMHEHGINDDGQFTRASRPGALPTEETKLDPNAPKPGDAPAADDQPAPANNDAPAPSTEPPAGGSDAPTDAPSPDAPADSTEPGAPAGGSDAPAADEQAPAEPADDQPAPDAPNA